jgi:hypothetical protein
MRQTGEMLPIHRDLYTKAMLTIIAGLLAILAVQRAGEAPPVQAQAPESWLYVEPQTTIIRPPEGGQIQGKVMIDLRNGDIWGFPTNSTAPYPVDLSKSEPPVSKPVYLGKFDLAPVRRGR